MADGSGKSKLANSTCIYQTTQERELPIDPSPVYKNSGGNYPNAKDFNFKIQAYNKHGETVRSAGALPYIPDLAKPKAPNGVAYTNMKSENTGYIMIDWEEIENASGYEIVISNGKTYTSFDVGGYNALDDARKRDLANGGGYCRGKIGALYERQRE